MPRRLLIPFRHVHKLRPYMEAAEAAGMQVVPGDVAQPVTLDGVGGLLLMGGTDVNPARYGQEPHPETDSPDEERDRIELELIDYALARDLPILAICRGLQILNVYHGGTLIQHLPSDKHARKAGDRSAPVHEIRIDPSSLLAEIAGTSCWRVNSRHHQAADRIGGGLAVTARDPEDQVVEGLERRDRRFVLAVQWHPEDQICRAPEQLKLFRRLAESL
jgi:gamma-glutamyl-gamma-aminobutyrate hydrolase PuuD